MFIFAKLPVASATPSILTSVKITVYVVRMCSQIIHTDNSGGDKGFVLGQVLFSTLAWFYSMQDNHAVI